MSAALGQDVRLDTFRAMGVEIAITGVAITPAQFTAGLGYARAMAEIWERTFSRFRPESLLSQLNRANGQPVPVSMIFLDVLRAAASGVLRTQGRFNPAVLPALESAGYTQTFDRLRQFPPGANEWSALPADIFWVNEVEIDHDELRVRIAAEARLDLGGIAKGAFVDHVADHLRSWPGGAVDAGGDIRVWGESPTGQQWRVAIEDPDRHDHDLLTLELLAPGEWALATSGPARRRWTRGESTANHLIDPGNGLPISEHVRSVTVVASQCIEAEISTKSLVVLLSRGEHTQLPANQSAITYCHPGGIEVFGHAFLSDRTLSTVHTPSAAT